MQIPGESIGIIADDLTGACDTALQFHLEGANTRILLDYTAASQTASVQTWLINTDSRHLEQYDAIAAVRKSVHFLRQAVSLDRFYKKVDSTLRGHIAHECLAILDELRWKAAIIAPAYPDEGRRTVGGYQLVRGVPVGHTEISRDPLCPVRESHIPTLLGKVTDPSIVGYIPLSTVMEGAGPILMAIQEQVGLNKKLIVVDACTDTDLEQLSLAINKMPSDINVLACGSAGLAKALSKKWILHMEPHPRPHLVIDNAPLFMVIGSASQTTRAQVKTFIKHFADFDPDGRLEVVCVSPAQILGLDSVEAEIEKIITGLSSGTTVILSTSLEEESLSKTMILAEEQNMTPLQASDKASQLLSEMTSAILSKVPAKLLVSGGETANAVCKAIQTRTLQVVEPLETSIPMMIDEHARWIITKSGSFGDDMSLLSIFKRLKHMESREEATHV